MEVNFQKIDDDDYKCFETDHQEPLALKLDETLEMQIDLARAKILAQNFNWNRYKFATKNILREDCQGKIYCDPRIASNHFFPFEVAHSNPRLVKAYRRRFEAQTKRRLPRTLSSSESEDMHIS